MKDTAVSTSGIEILEWVQQFPMKILQFSSNPVWKYRVVKTDLGDAILIYSNWGCSIVSLSKLERVWGLFWDQHAK